MKAAMSRVGVWTQRRRRAAVRSYQLLAAAFRGGEYAVCLIESLG
jgi:hypothetical protein